RDADRVDDHCLLRARFGRPLVDLLEEDGIGPRPVNPEESDPDSVARGKGNSARDAAEHVLARDAERLQLEVRDRRLDDAGGDPETGAGPARRRAPGRPARPARETPQTGAPPPASSTSRNARSSSAETRGKPASIRSILSESSSRAISSFCSGSSTTPTACS